jgi:nucleoside-triphosphatase THEP1
MKKLLIYTGPVHSGKSSRLLSFVQNRKDIGGILTPRIENKKYIYNISSGEKELLEADTNDKTNDLIVAGKYKFQKKVFEWGREVLLKASGGKYSYLIIDEIGPLELSGEGLAPIADDIIKKNNSIDSQLLVVVRESLINKFLEHYRLSIPDINFFTLN